MMEQNNTVPDEGYVFERKRKKGISKDPNAETFWADMPYYVEIAKAKEQNSKWGPKKIIAELKLGLSERVVKTVLSKYFYDQNTDCLFRKSIDLNVHHRRCVSKNDLVNMIKENHKKDHRKADTIYEALRTTVFPVVRETIKILFKTEVKCQQCASAIDLPKTTTTLRPIPATYPNSRWQEAMDILEMDTNEEETSRGKINSTNNNNNTENVNKESEISKQSSSVEENPDERFCGDEAVVCDPLASASHYYRALYERQFGTDLTNETNPNYNPCTSQNQFVNEGLMEYFKKKQLELYPLELFGGDCENVFTPTVGGSFTV